MWRCAFLVVVNILAQHEFPNCDCRHVLQITVTAPAEVAGTYGCAPYKFGSTNAKAGSEISLSIPGTSSLKDDMNNDHGDGCSIRKGRRMVSPSKPRSKVGPFYWR